MDFLLFKGWSAPTRMKVILLNLWGLTVQTGLDANLQKCYTATLAAGWPAKWTGEMSWAPDGTGRFEWGFMYRYFLGKQNMYILYIAELIKIAEAWCQSHCSAWHVSMHKKLIFFVFLVKNRCLCWNHLFYCWLAKNSKGLKQTFSGKKKIINTLIWWLQWTQYSFLKISENVGF